MKNILVSSGLRYNKVALLEDNKLVDYYIDDSKNKNTIDNIYLGIVRDSVRKYDSVFIDISLDKNAYMSKDNTDKLPLEGEKVLVQVIRDDTDTKGVSVSKNISLVGRYVVLIVNHSDKNKPKSDIMFSNDFNKSLIDDIRKGLKENIELDSNMGLIVRTEGEGKDLSDIINDARDLLSNYKDIEKQFEEFKLDKKDKTPRCIYEKNITDIVINEFYDKSISKIICDKDDLASKMTKKMDSYKLDSTIVEVFNDKDNKENSLSLFDTFKVEDEVKKALGRYAWLKSGGQIIIEHTEALTVIDVNSNKCEGKKEIEESSFKVNMEAAREIARQIRLRNISGIIIVDFINMKDEEHNKELLKALKDFTKEDKIKVNILGMTKLGLVEMTRQKKRKMLKDIIKNNK